MVAQEGTKQRMLRVFLIPNSATIGAVPSIGRDLDNDLVTPSFH